MIARPGSGNGKQGWFRPFVHIRMAAPSAKQRHIPVLGDLDVRQDPSGLIKRFKGDE